MINARTSFRNLHGKTTVNTCTKLFRAYFRGTYNTTENVPCKFRGDFRDDSRGAHILSNDHGSHLTEFRVDFCVDCNCEDTIADWDG